MALELPSSIAYSRFTTLGSIETPAWLDLDDALPSPPRRRVLQPESPLQSPGTTVQKERIFQSSGSVRVDSFNFLTEHIAKLHEQRRVDQEIKAQIEVRVGDLRIDACLSGDLLSAASLRDLLAFLKPLTLARRPAIFLLDNGNFRALWKNEVDEQVGLQFLGGGVVQYVIFARRENPPILTPHTGRDAAFKIRAQITAIGCDHLLFG